MKYINDSGHHYRCEIEEDSNVGFYLYIFDRKTGECVRDHLQDSFEIAKEQALDDYGASLDLWEIKKKN